MKRAAELFFPRGAECLLCGDPRRADERYCLCPECRVETLALRLRENVCIHCMHPLDVRGNCPFCQAGLLSPMSEAYGAFRYTGAAAQLIKLLKFGYQDEAAETLAAGMAQCFNPAEYDALTPVPLHRTRQRVRGLNQSRLLCELVGARTGLPVLDMLNRTRKTREQAKFHGAGNRRRNVEGAFQLAADVSGLRLLLVDDVRTTGATARACAETLLAGGAKGVALLTAAIAVQFKKHK